MQLQLFRHSILRLSIAERSQLRPGKSTSHPHKILHIKLSLCPRHGGVWRGRSIAPHIFNLGTRWRSVVIITLRPLYPRNRNQQPLNSRPGKLQSSSRRCSSPRSPNQFSAASYAIMAPRPFLHTRLNVSRQNAVIQREFLLIYNA